MNGKSICAYFLYCTLTPSTEIKLFQMNHGYSNIHKVTEHIMTECGKILKACIKVNAGQP